MTLKHITAALAVAALLVPTAATADGKGKGSAGDGPATTHKQDKAKSKGKGHGKAKNAVFKGTVVSVDAAAGTVVVKVAKTNRWARAFKGQDVTFTTKSDLTAVKPGDKVQVQARIKRGQAAPFAARKFKVYAPEAPEEPAPAPAPAP